MNTDQNTKENIANQKNDEKKLNEEKCRNVIEYSTQLFYTHDTNHVISYISPQSFNMFGYKPEEMMVKWTSLVTENPINEEGLRKTEESIKTGEAQEPYLLEFLKKNGNAIWVEVNEAPMKDENDKVVGMTGALTDVTKRKNMEDELKKSEEQMRVMYQNSPDAIYLYDFLGNFVDGNKAAEEMMGSNKEDFIGKSFLELNMLSKNDIARAAKGVASSKMGNTVGPDEYRLKKADGSFIDVETRSFPVEIGGKKLVMGIARNISDRKNIEEARGKFQVLYESINEGVVFHELVRNEQGDPINYKITNANPAFEIQTGAKRENVVGKMATEAYGVSEPPYFKEYVEVVDSKKSIVFETYFKPLDKYFSVFATSPEEDKFITVFSDVTEQKKKQEDLEKFQLGLDHISEAVFMLDRDGIFEYINPAFEKMYGYKSEEVSGKTPRILKSGKADQIFYERFWQDLLSKKTLNIELTNKTKDGKFIEISAAVGAILNEGGEVVGFLAVQKNITDDKNRENELRKQMNQQDKINKLMIGRELKMVELKKSLRLAQSKNSRDSSDISNNGRVDE